MVLLILLIISIILQGFAAAVAIRLTRVTKFNASWFMITIALVLMCIMRLWDILNFCKERFDLQYDLYLPEWASAWIGVMTSLCFAAGVVLINKVVNYMRLMERQRRNYETRILNAVIQAEETQRQRFAKELHDGLGPLLSSVKMGMSALSNIECSKSEREIFTNADHNIGMAIKSLREISNNLSPHILESFGLCRAIESFINRLTALVPAQIVFTGNLKQFRFDTQKEVIIYRVACELINNGMKHSRASLIKLDIIHDKNMLTLRYHDNGCGYDTSAENQGMGLSNISSRISSIKGEMSIESSSETGTHVTIKFSI